MAVKTFVIQNTDGSYKYEKVRGFVPKDAIIGKLAFDIFGNLEDPRWIQLEQIINPETGLPEPTFTVDVVKKAQVEAQDAADEQARQDEENQKASKRQDVNQRINTMNPNQIKDLADIKQAIEDIKEYILFKGI